MKKIKALIFSLVIIGITVSSCTKDSDVPSGPAPTIETKWNRVQTAVTINNQSIVEPYVDNVNGCNRNYLEFTPEKVFNQVVYFKPAGGGPCQTNAATPETWSKTNNMLTISGTGNLSGTYTIVKLTYSELQISISSNEGGISKVTTIFMTRAQ